jgi:hypothetical protein
MMNPYEILGLDEGMKTRRLTQNLNCRLSIKMKNTIKTILQMEGMDGFALPVFSG